ncbi:hypothetical protein BJV78DRAFT_1213635 [Lactifluus subvellereus]|nr:hypothetical protein BJV78DRAFT_1213635 [Lactifluus subvellereus]
MLVLVLIRAWTSGLSEGSRHQCSWLSPTSSFLFHLRTRSSFAFYNYNFRYPFPAAFLDDRASHAYISFLF